MNGNGFARFLKFANVQMAAESFFSDLTPNQIEVAKISGKGEMNEARLRLGNRRASLFTSTLAAEFTINWEVVEHISNTATGFSGTLFKASDQGNASLGIKPGELVLSFRSTEFVDDAVRDNQATNTMEIFDTGFALGQIADMEKWYQTLRSRQLIPDGAELNVTGYSLGGHLATAFNMLRATDLQTSSSIQLADTVTFNGAGVGKVNGGTLRTVLQDFETARSQAPTFSHEGVTSLYQELEAQYLLGIPASQADIDRAKAVLDSIQSTQANRQRRIDAQRLIDAISRVKQIGDEAVRIAGYVSGGSSPGVAAITLDKIEQASLRYQLAFLAMKGRTSPGSRYLTEITGRDTQVGGLGNFFDVYGAVPPSAVANSQFHYGVASPIFIEDQPLFRGRAVTGAIGQTLKAGETKLLVDEFGENDFGDTHSLSLLIDSLMVQSVISQLDPTVSIEDLSALLKHSSNLAAKSVFSEQGTAEGDVLENVVNYLATLTLGAGRGNLRGNPGGNTWFQVSNQDGGYTGRESLHQLLGEIASSSAFAALRGKVKVKLTSSNSSIARSSLGQSLALLHLSPIVLETSDPASIAAFKLANSQDVANWEADATLTKAQIEAGQASVSDQWIVDRTAFVTALSLRNRRNYAAGAAIPTLEAQGSGISADFNASLFRDEHAGMKVQVTAGAEDGSDRKQVWFGSDEANTLIGRNRADSLYGRSGDDTLTGGKGADHLEGGTDFDRYNFTAGDGRDTIIDTDGKGGLYFGGKPFLRGVRVRTDKTGNTWVDETAGLLFKFEPATAGSKIGTLEIRQYNGSTTSLGKTDVITIKGFDLSKAEYSQSDAAGTNNYLSIRLAKDKQAYVSPNVDDNPFTQPGINPEFRTTSISEGGSTPVNVSFNTPLEAGQKIRLTLTGALLSKPDAFRLLANGQSLAFNGGILEIDAPAGQSQLYLSLSQTGGLDADISGDLEVTLLDSSGQPVTNDDGNAVKSAMTLTVEAIDDADGNVFNTDGQATEGADLLVGTAAQDIINALGGNDVIHNTGEGNDKAEGGDGNDRILADLQLPLDWNDAISISATQERASINGRYIAGSFMSGGAGNDRILGQGADDILAGGTGEDLLIGGGGIDLLVGDTLTADLSSAPWAFTPQLALNTDGTSYLTVNILGGTLDLAQATAGANDTLHGGGGEDYIFGDGGNDTLHGEDGDDKLFGGHGNDTVLGGAGNDYLSGDYDKIDNGLIQSGDDYLDGGTGDDQLRGNRGNDVLIGGAGNDTLNGDDIKWNEGAGKDYLDGGDGNDTLFGGALDDQLFGGSGNDTLIGDAVVQDVEADKHGKDYLDGEAGDDILIGNGGEDRLFGGADNDRLFGDAQELAGDKHADDYLDGEEGDDELTGQGGADRLFGGAGNDTIQGDAAEAELAGQYHGDDEIDGESGNDTLYGQGGNDILIGGEGDDLLHGDDDDLAIEFHGDDHLEGGEGNDTLVGGGGKDALFGQAGDDTLDGGAGDDELHGGEGDDSLQGGDGDDYLDGGAGLNSLEGGAGNDTLVVGGEGGVYQGGEGDDTYFVSSADAVTLIGDEEGENRVVLFDEDNPDGIELRTVYARIQRNGNRVAGQVGFSETDVQGGTQSVAITQGGRVVAFENAFLSGNAEIVTANGVTTLGAQIAAKFEGSVALQATDGNNRIETGRGNDTVYASAGDDVVLGNAGADFLHGGAGADTLMGGEGDDVLYGGNGNDTLVGGTGTDALDGGAGNDVYLLERGDGNKYISDWRGADTVRFGAGITRADLKVERFGRDGDTYTWIQYGNEGDQITLLEMEGDGGVSSFEFADGTSVSRAALVEDLGVAWEDQVNITLDGTDSRDVIIAGDLDNEIMGRGGNDRIYGGGGSDFIDAGDGDDFVNTGSGSDSALGGRGNDTLVGEAGRQTLTGGEGDDVLDGGRDADVLIGGEGNDTLIAGAGNDSLQGGAGDDRYVLSAGHGVDLIEDADGQNVLVFDASITGNALFREVRGDDLYIGTSSTSGVLIRSYQPDSWRFERGDGSAVHVPDRAANRFSTNVFELAEQTYQASVNGFHDYFQSRGAKRMFSGYQLMSSRELPSGSIEGSSAYFTFEQGAYSATSGGEQYADSGFIETDSQTDVTVLPETTFDVFGGMTASVPAAGNGSGGDDDSAPIDLTSTWEWVPGDSASAGAQSYGSAAKGHFKRVGSNGLSSNGQSLRRKQGNDGSGGGSSTGGSIAGSAFSTPNGGMTKTFNVFNQASKTVTTTRSSNRWVFQTLEGHVTEDSQLFLNDGGIIVAGSGNDILSIGGGVDPQFPSTLDEFGNEVAKETPDYALTRSLLSAGGGDDYLEAFGGGDFFIGGDGSDSMWGGYGEDVYIFNAGESGLDTIFDGDAPTYREQYAIWSEHLVPGNEGVLRSVAASNIDFRSPRVEQDRQDIIRFGAGIGLNQLAVSQGQMGTGDEIDSRLSGRRYVDLHVGSAQTIRVFLARDYDPALRTEFYDEKIGYEGEVGYYPVVGSGHVVGAERFIEDLNESRNTGIEWVEFADGTRRSFQGLVASLPPWTGGVNTAPIVAIAPPDLQLQGGQVLDLFFGEENFQDDGGFAGLTFNASLANGDALPDWLTLNGTRLLGTPPRNAEGEIVVRISATDAGGLSVSSTFTLTLSPADNTAPEIDQAIGPVTATEDTLFSWQVPGNAFTDLDDAAQALAISVSLENGDPLPSWLAFDSASRTLSGTPANGDVGIANIRITATDSQGLSVSQVVALAVANTNDGPVVSAALQDSDATEGVAFQVVIPPDAFADEDAGDILTYSVELEDGGALPAWLTFDASTRVISGVADDAQVGVHRLRVTATDAAGASASVVFSLTLNNVNEGPLAAIALADAQIDEGAAFSLVLPEGLFTDPDAGDAITLSVTLASGAALPGWLSFDAATRTLSGIADDDAVGEIVLRVVGTDGAGLSATVGFRLTVQNTNDGPVAVGDVINLADVPGGNLHDVLLVNDTDADQGDALTIAAVSGAGEYGTLSLDSSQRTLEYSAGGAAYTALAEGESALETFTYTVRDQSGAESTATVSLTVIGRNDGPALAGTINSVNATEDQALNFVIPDGVFVDADRQDVLTYSARLVGGAELPSWLSLNGQTGRFTGTPRNDHVGALEIELTATDRAGAAVSTTFMLRIANSNDAPITVGTVADQLVDEDSVFSITLPDDLFQDADGEPLRYSVTRVNGDDLPTWLRFDPVSRSLSGTPGNEDVGTLAIRVTATDAVGEAAATDFVLTVNNTNDAPVLVTPLADLAIRAGRVTSWALPANAFADPDAGDSLTYSATLADGTALPDWLVLDPASGVFTGQPGSTAAGEYSIRVTARDPSGAEVHDDFSVTVGPTEGVTLVGGNGAETLTGGAGDDTIDGRGGADRLFGRGGNDRLLGGRGADYLDGGEGDDTVLAGAGFDQLFGREGDDYLNGEDGEDTLDGGTGNDILQGGRGADTLTGGEGNNLLDGGAGADQLVAGGANDILIGGQGRDVITTGAGNDVIAFNRGDGADTVQLGQGGTDTLSLGGDIDLSQLRFQKQGDDLRLLLGSGDSILFDSYYSEGASRSLVNLQIVRSAEASLDPQDPLRDNRVEVFDFNELVARFDAAREANPRRNRWALMDALLDAHVAGSDDAAIGGDLAYRYGADGTLAGLSVDPVKTLLANNQLNTQMQTIRPVAALQTSGQTLT